MVTVQDVQISILFRREEEVAPQLFAKVETKLFKEMDNAELASLDRCQMWQVEIVLLDQRLSVEFLNQVEEEKRFPWLVLAHWIEF